MSDDTVTITARMLTDIPEKAAESAAAVKALGEEVKDSSTSTSGHAGATEQLGRSLDGTTESTGAAANATQQLGKHIDGTNDRTTKAATGGMTQMSKAMKNVQEQGNKLRESIAGIGESITERLTYPVQQLTWALEGAAAGMVTFGLTTMSSLQQTNLQLTEFTGSSSTGGAAMKALEALRNPASLGALSGSYESLMNGGASSQLALSLTKALAGAGAVSGNSDALLGSVSASLSNVIGTGGLMSSGDIESLQTAFPQIYSLLARDVGTNASTLRRGVTLGGESLMMPSNFFSQLEGTRQATGGLGAYDQTFAGQLGQMKTAFGQMLSVVEAPLGSALGQAATRIDTWATGVEGRFGQMKTTLGADWNSGNIGGFATALATTLGDPRLSGDIKTVTEALRSMGTIITGSVIPAGKEVLTIATPALKGLADVLDLMAAHKTTTEALLISLGGFVVLSKVAQWGNAARLGILGFQEALESGGLMQAITRLGRGLLGLKTAEEGVSASSAGGAVSGTGSLAAGAGEAAAGGSVAGAAGIGLGGSLGLGAAGAAAAALAGWGIYSGLDKGNNLGTSYVKAASLGGTNLPSVAGLRNTSGLSAAAQSLPSDLSGANLGVLASLNPSLLGATTAGSSSAAMNVNTINVNVAGAGNPEKVANSIPKSINAQVASYQARQSRRSSQGAKT